MDNKLYKTAPCRHYNSPRGCDKGDNCVFAHGEIEVSFDMKPYGRKLPSVLPRIGVVFELDGSFKNCKWLGRGLEESYQDCKAHTFIGIHESEVSKMYFRYDVPQETGNHEDCRLLTVSGKGGALTVSGKFSFSLHDFTLENLTAARHCDELIQSEKNYLYIDYKHRGLGSNSCGPQPEEQYELKAEPFRWHFLLKA